MIRKGDCLDILYKRMINFLPGSFDPKTTDKRYLVKAQFGIMQLLMRDENTNVNGFVFLIDMTKINMKHQLFWGREGIKMRMNIAQVCVRECRSLYVNSQFFYTSWTLTVWHRLTNRFVIFS